MGLIFVVARDQESSQPAKTRISLDRHVSDTLHSHVPQFDRADDIGLSFFIRRTFVQLNDGFHPALWDHLRHVVVSSDGCMRTLAIAIGVRQLTIESTSTINPPQNGQNVLEAYSRAITSVHSAIANSSIDKENLLLACLLLVLLETLYSRPAAIRVHLQNALRLIEDLEAGEIPTIPTYLRELFVRLALESTMRSPLDMMGAARAIPRAEDLPRKPSLEYLHSQVTRLFHESFKFAGLVTVQSPLDQHGWEAEYDPLQASIQQCRLDIASYQSTFDARAEARTQTLCNVLHAHCLVYDVFVDCVRSRYQTTYDRRKQSFLEAVSLLQTALTAMSHEEDGQARPALFSMDLGIAMTLSLITMLCRDPRLRRQSLQLMELCPTFEGEWTSDWARRRSQAIIDFEEHGLQVDGDGYPHFVPEERRIHYIRHDADYASLEVYWRPNGDSLQWSSKKVMLI